MSDLRDVAIAAGIKVDKRWGEGRLRSEIEKAMEKDMPDNIEVTDGGPKPEKGNGLVAVRVQRDYWTSDGERVRAGTVVEVSVEDALDGVETGALSRVKG